jgi:hypothetical protein
MARKAGQLIARGQSTWLIRVYLGRDPQTRDAQIPQPDPPWFLPRGAAISQSQAAAARQWPSLSGRGTKSQPIARPVTDDSGQGASQDENIQGL